MKSEETRASRVCTLVSRGLQFRRLPLGSQCKDRFPLSRNFHVSTNVHFTRLSIKQRQCMEGHA